MKKLLILFMLLTQYAGIFAQTFKPTDEGSSIDFTIRNFGLNVNGKFKGSTGSIIFNPGNLAAASFRVNVEAATINTGNGSRDGHLKKEEYFNVTKYPSLNFVSHKISGSNSQGSYMVEGTITIKGTTKNISFPFTATAVSGGYLFKGTFKLNRRDFNVGGSSLVLSDNLNVSLSVLASNQ